jgi:hypothetical protein
VTRSVSGDTPTQNFALSKDCHVFTSKINLGAHVKGLERQERMVKNHVNSFAKVGEIAQARQSRVKGGSP